ncbi:MAG: isoprenyl transferase [Candidatus Marinimicrobia bacterium]|nr:isoprenyl transferase [Candidatus Neomarinimicrobiota bacterium]
MENGTEQEQQQRILGRGSLPGHIAIIMDGNGRWARKQGLPRVAGHKAGVVSVREITRAAGELGIAILTLYTFSSENWKRPRAEVDALMRLLVSTIRAEVEDLLSNNVRLTAIGRLEELPTVAQREFEAAMEATAGNSGLNLNLALSYGGRQEILDGVRQLARDVQAGKLAPDDISREVFSACLYTADLPDPDLIIRTGGEARLSNFLIWQSAYSELVITDAMWPEFRRRELYNAIEVYQQRERRFGKISEQVQSIN